MEGGKKLRSENSDDSKDGSDNGKDPECKDELEEATWNWVVEWGWRKQLF